ncbi:MAG: response regulator [Polyangiaceae bacterium]|nr:response regulator [Polyangiaceae bacterium]
MNVPRRRILFVDDSETCREAVKQMLQSRGYDVTTLDSPFGFGAAVARTSPDLILVDVYMPALDGGKLVEVAMQKGICSCPIVFLSERPVRELQSLVLSTKATGFIVKTSDGDDLAKQVAEYLDGTWQKRERAPESLRPPSPSGAGQGRMSPFPRPSLRPSDVPPPTRRGSDLPPLTQRAPSLDRSLLDSPPPPSQRNGWTRK